MYLPSTQHHNNHPSTYRLYTVHSNNLSYLLGSREQYKDYRDVYIDPGQNYSDTLQALQVTLYTGPTKVTRVSKATVT